MGTFTPEAADDYGDLRDPFTLKKTLAALEAELYAAFGPTGSGTGGRTVTFSQAAGAPAITGGSPKFIVPFDCTVLSLHISATAAPEGSAATVQCLVDGEVAATLQLEDGSTSTVAVTDDLPTLTKDSELTVNATEVGSSTAAWGLAVQWELG